MANVTYEYHSKGSPVIMHEKINGFTVALYTAYIDRHANGWWLYPRERIRACKIPFEKKYVPMRRSVVLPPITASAVPNSSPKGQDGEGTAEKKGTQVKLV